MLSVINKRRAEGSTTFNNHTRKGVVPLYVTKPSQPQLNNERLLQFKEAAASRRNILSYSPDKTTIYQDSALVHRRNPINKTSTISVREKESNK